MQRIDNVWYCTWHEEIHVGEITSWSMDHRQRIHPVFADVRDRTQERDVFDKQLRKRIRRSFRQLQHEPMADGGDQ